MSYQRKAYVIALSCLGLFVQTAQAVSAKTCAEMNGWCVINYNCKANINAIVSDPCSGSMLCCTDPAPTPPATPSTPPPPPPTTECQNSGGTCYPGNRPGDTTFCTNNAYDVLLKSCAGSPVSNPICCGAKNARPVDTTDEQCIARGGACDVASACTGGTGGNIMGYCAADKVCCVKTPTTKKLDYIPGTSTDLPNPLGAGTTILDVIQRVIASFLGIAGALALAVFIYGGVMYMTAGGSDRVKEAQDTLKYAAIGLVIISFAYTFANMFFYLLAGSSAV